MKTFLFALLLFFQSDTGTNTTVEATPQRFQTVRTLTAPAGANGQTCAIVDAPVYAHTDGRLTGLRIYRVSNGQATTEVPFALTESGEANQRPESARVLNLGAKPGAASGQGSAIAFDLAMPQREYTSVTLSLDAHNFLASAHVFGASTPDGPRTDLGTFALFDLQAQGLSRSTTLPLQEVSFPILHVELTLRPAPGAPPDAPTVTPQIVTGAEVPPSREAQTLYTTVAQTTSIATRGRESVAVVLAPAHVPVERTLFSIPATFSRNFSRSVSLDAFEGTQRPVAHGPRDIVPTDEVLSGEIDRVSLPASGFNAAIRNEQLSIESVLSSNLRSDATVNITVQNQDDAPLPIAAIALQMRQRKLCFEAEPGTGYALLYGTAESVRAPVYDYTRLFQPSDTAASATLGPEAPNPLFVAGPQTSTKRSYLDRHPELLWIVLILVISALGTVAVRSAKRAGGS